MGTVYIKLRCGPFDKIKSGVKTVEVRLFDEKRQSLAPGDVIVFKRLPDLTETLSKKIVRVKRFDTFAGLFSAYQKESLGCAEDDTSADFARAMGRYYSDEEATRYGVCAIELAPCGVSESW